MMSLLPCFSTVRSLLLTALGLLVGLALAAPPVRAQIHVDKDATGANDGTSWTDAYTDLQTAIDAATSSNEIWIAEGVYRPSTSDPSVRFTIPGSKNGLEIYGGFEGVEFERSNRDPSVYRTVLSGDVGGDDATTASGVTVSAAGINGDNTHSVLHLDGESTAITTSTVIDGVTITAGQADGTGFPGEYGGGVYCDGVGTECSPTLRNVVFAGNSATSDGGALYNDGYAGTSSPQITNAVFVGNRAGGGGGALYNDGRSGGASSPAITNATFTGNSASDGGAIYNRANNNATITNTILWKNTARGGSGDQLYNDGSGTTPSLSHSIVEDGSDGISENNSSSTDYLDDTGSSVVFSSSTNLSSDPRFEYAARPTGSDGRFASSDDGLRLISSSPALDAGDDAAVSITNDLTGAPRTQNGTVDIGAYEGWITDQERTVFVNASSTSGPRDGTSWGTALPDLNEALAAATQNDEIWIAEGVYTPTAGTDPEIRFRIPEWKDGLKLYGGFAGGESFRSARAPATNATVLSGDIDNNDDTNADGVTETAADINGTNSYHVLQMASQITGATVIEGVTVTAGDATNIAPARARGGGLVCLTAIGESGETCSPTLRDLVIAGNRARNGGGMYLTAQGGTVSPTITNVVFTGNKATFDAGALYSVVASPQIESSVFVNNSAVREGGAAVLTGSSDFRSITFVGNEAREDGGAIYSSGGSSDIEISNSILWGNSADADGNGTGTGDQMYNDDAAPTVTHTVIEGGVNGPGVAGNTANVDDGANFDADPQFADITDPDGPDETFGTADDRIAVKPGSPVIDKGEFALAATDVTGVPRVQDDDGDGYDNANLGAYEVLAPAPPTAATGTPSTTSDTEASFSGTVNPSGAETTVEFRYREAGAASFTSVAATESPLTGTSDQSVSASVSGLQADTEYEVRVEATNVSGTTEGPLKTLVTPPPNLSTTYTRRIVGEDGTGTDAGWRMLAQPAASRTRAALEDDVDFGRASSILYRWTGSSWSAQDQSSDALPRGEGFILYFFDDAQSPLTSDGTALDVDRGSEDPQVDKTVSGLSDGDRFHLLGNPYDIAFDLGSLAGGDLPGAGFQATVQVWDPNAGRYEPIIQGASNDDIPAWQGFFAQRSSVGAGQTSLTFAAAGRLSTDGALIGSKSTSKVLASTDASRDKRNASTNEAKAAPQTAEVALKLTVTSEGGAPVYTDQATYWVDARAGSGYDAFEARDLPPPTSAEYATATFPVDRSGDLVERTLAAVPYPTDGLIDQSAPLSVRGVGVSGSATLSWPDPSAGSVPDSWNVRLKDTETGDVVNLRLNDYSFDLAEGQSIASSSESRFRLIVRDSAIPVELASFEGTQRDAGVDLSWTTASEQNNAGFKVQHRAPTAQSWKRLGFVDGAGTTAQPQQYRFTVDEDLAPGAHRFRLKQVDTDGTTHLSEPVTVSLQMTEPVRLAAPAPNPVRQRATLSFAVKEAQTTTIRLYNVLGQAVTTLYRGTPPAEETQTVDLSATDLSSGVYFLRLQAGERSKTQRMTVVK